MALGKPVVATAVGGTEEQFIHDANQTFLVRDLIGSSSFVSTVERAWRMHLAGQLQDVGAEMGRKVAKPATDQFEQAVKQLIEHIVVPRQPAVCFVMRTFYKHMTDPVLNLENSLRAMQRQHFVNWEVILLQTDPKPMENIFGLLARLGDPRIRFVKPVRLPEHTVGGYEVTDAGIQQCSSTASWLVVTNSDNVYEPAFTSRLVAKEHAKADVVAFDFYSRSAHVLDSKLLGGGCKRFFSHAHAACKPNLLRLWHTDLGSNAMNLHRWRCEAGAFTPSMAVPPRSRMA
jgi:hypothetical protein